MTIKILNLYAGIGGNRKLWGGDIEVTAIENNEDIAKIYQHFFPNDKVIIADAHQYLLEHFREYDFIWTSPPCPTHSRARKLLSIKTDSLGNKYEQNKPVFPDMKLYEEILLLQGYFKGKFVVENVVAWYEPLIEPQIIAKHFFWSNFVITPIENKSREHDSSIEILQQRKGFDLTQFSKIDKKTILRNCVEPEVGLHILNEGLKT